MVLLGDGVTLRALAVDGPHVRMFARLPPPPLHASWLTTQLEFKWLEVRARAHCAGAAAATGTLQRSRRTGRLARHTLALAHFELSAAPRRAAQGDAPRDDGAAPGDEPCSVEVVLPDGSSAEWDARMADTARRRSQRAGAGPAFARPCARAASGLL